MAGKRKKSSKSLAELAWGIRPLLRLAAQYSATSQELLKMAKGLGSALQEVAAPQPVAQAKPRHAARKSRKRVLSATQRKALSDRMKARWAEKRKGNAKEKAA